MDGARVRRWLRAGIDLATLAAALVFLGSYFPGSVMLTPTITNGGDMGSHYYPALYLRDVLLPKGQVSGWCPGNYCGFPLFQLYFPLPFVICAALSSVVQFPIAFKLVTVLGVFLLPVCGYLSLRLMRVPFPGPALGALSTLCFLFLEANSMWGGNIPSTLAGEFTFSLGVALAILFLGTLRWTLDTGRGYAWNGLLVALIGLAHGYTLLWAGGVSLLELVATRGWWRRFGTLVAVHGLAILLLGFWLVPLLAYAGWTTAFDHVWPIKNWQEVIPPILWPAGIVAVLTALMEAALCFVQRRPYPRTLLMLWGTVLVSVVFYYSAHSFHVPDVRFLPFVQLVLCLAAAAGLGHVLGALPQPEIWPIVGALATLPFVSSNVTFIPGWITWNYSGFETKHPWPVLRGLSDHLRGDFRSPRVVYEHAAVHESFGTVRVFESLPLFAGRSTLEGLYMQGSPSSPFVFYIQSEVSKEQSCPLPNWGCARTDLEHGVDHLRMMNVSQFIVRSDPVKKAAAAHPGLVREATFGQYEVYGVKDNDPRYAIPLGVAPVVVHARDWKPAAYRWFKRAKPADPVPVFADAVSAEEEQWFAGSFDELPLELPRRELGRPPPLHEEMNTDRITITGARPGHPVLIRISYHPRWRATTGERVWLAGPSFMLVVPKGERVELVFGTSAPVVVGHLLSLLGLAILVGAVVPFARPFARRTVDAVGGIAGVPPIRPVVAWVRSTGGWHAGRRRVVLAAGVVVAALGFAALAGAVRTPDSEGFYRGGQKLYEAGRLRDALPYFVRVQELTPLAAISIHAAYYEAIILYREREFVEAEKAFQHLVDTFPEGINAPEAMYHIGLCRHARQDIEGAVTAWQQTRDRFDGSPWAKYAGDRLSELKR